MTVNRRATPGQAYMQTLPLFFVTFVTLTRNIKSQQI
jgi:hypothetical protein